VYAATPDAYWENRGDGTFVDATARAGLRETTGKGLGVLATDFDDDGDQDLFVTNDSTPNFLWRNRGDGTFEEVALAQGVAYSEEGTAFAGMGVDAGDVDGDGFGDFVVTNFAAETDYLLTGGPRGFRHDERKLGVREPTLPWVGFGCALLDLDDDADLDLVIANGHIIDNIAEALPGSTHAQPGQAFLNDGTGRLVVADAARAGALARPAVARGLMPIDLDSDGRLDLVVTANGGPARVLRNACEPHGHWVGFELAATGANTRAIGSRVTVETAGRTQWRERRAGSSYQCGSDPRLHFGLGDATEVARVTVRWPDATTSTFERLAADRYWRLSASRAPEAVTP
jgi:hypothetical protein